MLDGLKAELERAMALCGAANIAALDPSLVRAASA
jgi:isopentenyl diphosphate isomerase/L-lactate dehydrogenase-like FMN-dependent dehydrogenase